MRPSIDRCQYHPVSMRASRVRLVMSVDVEPATAEIAQLQAEIARLKELQAQQLAAQIQPVAPSEPVLPTDVPALMSSAKTKVMEAVSESGSVDSEFASELPNTGLTLPDVGDLADNPFVLLGGIILCIPLVVVAVNFYVIQITGGSEEQNTPQSMRPPGIISRSEKVASGRSATSIFFDGLSNLKKDPFGWFFGPPSPLTSTQEAMPPSQSTSPRLGAKEAARKSQRIQTSRYESLSNEMDSRKGSVGPYSPATSSAQTVRPAAMSSSPRQAAAAPKSVAPTVAPQPVPPVAAKKVVAPVVVQKSAAPVAAKPVESKPVAAPVAAKPVATPIALQPIAKPVAAKPVAAKPITAPVAPQPVAAPVVAKPVAAPVTPQPVAKPLAAQPVAAPVAASTDSATALTAQLAELTTQIAAMSANYAEVKAELRELRDTKEAEAKAD
eukprot:CAMPEP_0119315256 /NCGR_PEP_ID=MMETSP1333-20130426/35041_1 /TAXON_ID=418940 /ORGANISM="Scyphosphaera apsteinii, Strain RCC1455" /LENGTH=440 /DNA_ID=CAMNT_0007320553 /DNA_START=103 /DNA_END=1425 /DNA_ORIENTATION=+